MLSLNTILASGTVSYFFPTLMGALGYKGRMVQCKITAYIVSLSVNADADALSLHSHDRTHLRRDFGHQFDHGLLGRLYRKKGIPRRGLRYPGCGLFHHLRGQQKLLRPLRFYLFRFRRGTMLCAFIDQLGSHHVPRSRETCCVCPRH